MKKFLCIILLFSLIILPIQCSAADNLSVHNSELIVRCDVDENGEVNTDDISAIINEIKKNETGTNPLKGDINEDGKVDIGDIVVVVKLLLDNGGNISGVFFQAAVFESQNSKRERELRDLYYNKVKENNYKGKWYGVQWDEIDNPDNVIAINSPGDESLHVTLPVQNRMRRCITKNNVVQYYLDANNSELKEDGTTANLNGDDGNVMVEIPEFFYKVEDETLNGVRTIRIKISEDALPDFLFSPKRYTSAYEATINQETGFLSSVCTTCFERNNSEIVWTELGSYIQEDKVRSRGRKMTARRSGHTTNAAKYRGGTNDPSFDEYENAQFQNYSRNQLGLPISNINIQEIRNACDKNQFGYLYDTQRTLFMLVQVEYKTRNIQKSLSEGGLGLGATQYPNANGGYEAFEAFFAPQGGISTIPCGVTNSLGNASGEVYYLLENVPVESFKDGEAIHFSRFANIWMPCMSYRGVEHYYGHIYKIADQVECIVGPTSAYVEGHEGDRNWSKHDVTWWYEPNPFLCNYINTEENKLGTWNFACHIMIASRLLMGENGHILHTGTVDKDRNKYYCDCSELDSRYNKRKYITFNGRIVSSNLVGNHFIVSFNTVNEGDKRPSDGTRLDHF